MLQTIIFTYSVLLQNGLHNIFAQVILFLSFYCGIRLIYIKELNFNANFYITTM